MLKYNREIQIISLFGHVKINLIFTFYSKNATNQWICIIFWCWSNRLLDAAGVLRQDLTQLAPIHNQKSIGHDKILN